MATTASFLSPRGFPPMRSRGVAEKRPPCGRRRGRSCSIMAQQQQQQVEQEAEELEGQGRRSGDDVNSPGERKGVEQLPRQPMAKTKNMSREYGGQWLCSVTRHVRIYAAYIDPVTHAFDQTQMDKLTLLLDPSHEFVWTPEACQKVYDCFRDLVDHYEGAPLSEYTLRLIGSDLEHYIRKLLYDGEIKYNLNARVLNFSMGKPRVKFNSTQLQNVQ